MERVWYLEGVTVPTANAVRRTLLGRLSAPAVTSVAFDAFDCCQHEEFVAQRLAMLPIEDNRPGEGLPPATLTLRAEGPAVLTDRDLVSSCPEHLRVRACGVELAHLRDGQRVHLEATVGRGTAREHARHQQVAVAFHRVVPRIAVPEGIAREELRRACPRGVFSDIEDAPERCVDCGACAPLGVLVDTGPKHEPGDASRRLRFEVETLVDPPETCVRRAVGVLREDLKAVEAGLAGLRRNF